MKKDIEKKIVLMSGASAAISYKKEHPNVSTEEAIGHVMKSLPRDRETKIFGIAGANFVLKILERRPGAMEKELMQNLSNESDNILMSIEAQALE